MRDLQRLHLKACAWASCAQCNMGGKDSLERRHLRKVPRAFALRVYIH